MGLGEVRMLVSYMLPEAVVGIAEHRTVGTRTSRELLGVSRGRIRTGMVGWDPSAYNFEKKFTPKGKVRDAL